MNTLSDLPMSTRLINLLNSNNITEPGQLYGITAAAFLRWRGAGSRGLLELSAVLDVCGISHTLRTRWEKLSVPTLIRYHEDILAHLKTVTCQADYNAMRAEVEERMRKSAV